MQRSVNGSCIRLTTSKGRDGFILAQRLRPWKAKNAHVLMCGSSCKMTSSNELVNFQVAVAVIIDQAHFSEPIHEKAHARSRRADHFREGFLADLRNNRLGLTFLAILREDEKKSSQALLAGIEELIDQIRLNSDVARQKMRHEPLGKFWLVVEKANHGCFLQPHDCGFLHCCGCRHAPGLPGQASLAAEIAGSKDCNDRLFPLLGKYGELHFALLDVENRICRLVLRKDNLIYFIGGYRPATVCIGEEGLGVERGYCVVVH